MVVVGTRVVTPFAVVGTIVLDRTVVGPRVVVMFVAVGICVVAVTFGIIVLDIQVLEALGVVIVAAAFVNVAATVLVAIAVVAFGVVTDVVTLPSITRPYKIH